MIVAANCNLLAWRICTSSCNLAASALRAGGSGVSILKSVSRHPAGASTDGCSEWEPHSMKNGKTPRSSFRASVFQFYVVPSGRDREPGFGPTHSTPAPRSSAANSSRSCRCTAQPTSAGFFRFAKKRGSLDAGCNGSGAMISKYREVPRDANAFLVPAPGCTPPAAARTPVL